MECVIEVNPCAAGTTTGAWQPDFESVYARAGCAVRRQLGCGDVVG